MDEGHTAPFSQAQVIPDPLADEGSIAPATSIPEPHHPYPRQYAQLQQHQHEHHHQQQLYMQQHEQQQVSMYFANHVTHRPREQIYQEEQAYLQNVQLMEAHALYHHQQQQQQQQMVGEGLYYSVSSPVHASLPSSPQMVPRVYQYPTTMQQQLAPSSPMHVGMPLNSSQLYVDANAYHYVGQMSPQQTQSMPSPSNLGDIDMSVYLQNRPTHKVRCKHWIQGDCARGSKCKFMHSGVKCRDWVRGECKLGSMCKFSHTGSRCRHWASGECKMGDHCKFQHTGTPGNANRCKHYAIRGSCRQGDKCKFPHTGTPGDITAKDFILMGGGGHKKRSWPRHASYPPLSPHMAPVLDASDAHHSGHLHVEQQQSPHCDLLRRSISPGTSVSSNLTQHSHKTRRASSESDAN